MAGVPSRRIVIISAVAIIIVGAVVAGAMWFADSRRVERSAPALCARLAEASSLDSALVTLDPTMLGPQVSALQHALEVAPADIEPQLAQLTVFVGEVADQVRASNTDKKKALVDALAARQDQIDAITADGQALEAWSITNCGTPLRTTTTSSTTTTTRPGSTTTTASASTTTSRPGSTTSRPNTTSTTTRR